MRNETFKLYWKFNDGDGRFIKRQISWFLEVIKHASLERTYYVLLGQIFWRYYSSLKLIFRMKKHCGKVHGSLLRCNEKIHKIPMENFEWNGVCRANKRLDNDSHFDDFMEQN
jgi:hypothetical protein